jgi:hypothetical protein
LNLSASLLRKVPGSTVFPNFFFLFNHNHLVVLFLAIHVKRLNLKLSSSFIVLGLDLGKLVEEVSRLLISVFLELSRTVRFA